LWALHRTATVVTSSARCDSQSGCYCVLFLSADDEKGKRDFFPLTHTPLLSPRRHPPTRHSGRPTAESCGRVTGAAAPTCFSAHSSGSTSWPVSFTPAPCPHQASPPHYDTSCVTAHGVRTEGPAYTCPSSPTLPLWLWDACVSSRASLQTVHLLPHATHHLLHSDVEAIARIFCSALSTAFSFHSLPASRLT
jgi:hypothetical protein